MTKNGVYPLLGEEENCVQITVTDEEITNSVKVVPKIETVVCTCVLLTPITSIRDGNFCQHSLIYISI